MIMVDEIQNNNEAVVKWKSQKRKRKEKKKMKLKHQTFVVIFVFHIVVNLLKKNENIEKLKSFLYPPYI